MATADDSRNSHPSYANPIDSDWEYEYDPHETEDIYFILDLTTHDPDAFENRKTAIDIPIPNTLIHPLPSLPTPSGAAPLSASPTTAPALQILGLHTLQPIVKFGPDVYNCSWSTDLGTALHVAPAGYISDVLKPGGSVDVVATSRARLLARPATLVPRRKKLYRGAAAAAATTTADEETGGEDAVIVIDVDDDDDDEINSAEGSATENAALMPLVVPLELRKTEMQDRQAAFLERLSAIKINKGERDRVGAYLDKSYRVPPPRKDGQDEVLLTSAGSSTKRKRSFDQA